MTTLLTPEQHRILAANVLRTAGTAGHRSKKASKIQAQHHENMAKMIEARAKREAASQRRSAY